MDLTEDLLGDLPGNGAPLVCLLGNTHHEGIDLFAVCLDNHVDTVSARLNRNFEWADCPKPHGLAFGHGFTDDLADLVVGLSPAVDLLAIKLPFERIDVATQVQERIFELGAVGVLGAIHDDAEGLRLFLAVLVRDSLIDQITHRRGCFHSVGVGLGANLHLERLGAKLLHLLVCQLGNAFVLGNTRRQTLHVVLGLLHAAFLVGDQRVVRALPALQLLDVVVQLDPAQQIGVSGGRGLHFTGRHFHVVETVLDLAADFTRAQLVDTPDLALLDVPHVFVERVLGHIGQDLDLKPFNGFAQFVALPNDAALALLNIRWLPWNVQVMQGNQALLHIGSGSHLGC